MTGQSPNRDSAIAATPAKRPRSAADFAPPLIELHDKKDDGVTIPRLIKSPIGLIVRVGAVIARFFGYTGRGVGGAGRFFAGKVPNFAGMGGIFAGKVSDFAGMERIFAGKVSNFAGKAADFAGKVPGFAGKVADFASMDGIFAGGEMDFAGVEMGRGVAGGMVMGLGGRMTGGQGKGRGKG